MNRSLLLALALLAGCGRILDIDDPIPADVPSSSDAGMRPPEDAMVGTDDGGLALSCTNYCSEARALCPAGMPGVGAQLFELDTQCFAVCAKYPVGTLGAAPGNTLACRLNVLDQAKRFGEVTAACQAAGPGGGSFKARGTSCGSNCEGFCNLRKTVCFDNDQTADCLTKCAALPDHSDFTYNAAEDFKSGKDTFNCRMAHLTTAAAYQADGKEKDRSDHCEHSGYRSTGPCELGAADVPSCQDYCALVTTGCKDNNKVYESQAQCMAVCAKLPNAANDDVTANTLRCRRAQAYVPLISGGSPGFCEAAGPAPLQCGASKCASYCSMLLGTCGGDANAPKTQADCLSACELNPDSKANQTITLANATGNSLSCRIKHLMTAIEKSDLRECADAIGGPAAPNCK